MEEFQPVASSELASFPNPFNPETTLKYNILKPGNVNMAIYNIKGQHITTLVNETLKSGSYSVKWSGCDKSGHLCASGVYFVRLSQNGKEIRTHKILLLK
jgi:hypothetical protein